MALQLAIEGVLLGVAGLGASDCCGEVVVCHHMRSSGIEGGNRFHLNGYVAHSPEVDVLVDKFCVVALLGTDDGVNCDTLLGVRSAPEGVRVDDVLHEGIKDRDVCDGNRKVSHRTLGGGGLDKVSHVWHFLPARSRDSTDILHYYFE